ncbi:acyl-CoA carboxylase epsilon subunit [Spongiactinospora gelatinilytica]|uniref:acyl-CoA carboxylase epsilon subunit n=1 Tax=Spongiactinospora gelatinilytica TaxID=2666298 RepID=UPI0011B94282|nr:acyl-CoA carboxylase epsilon subunit [Spongiactinospora gelatinilytica]
MDIRLSGAELTEEELAAVVIALLAGSRARPAAHRVPLRRRPTRLPVPGYHSPRSWRTRA